MIAATRHAALGANTKALLGADDGHSTWLHTGAWFEQSTLEAAFAKEWFTGDMHAPTLEPNRVASSSTLTPAERRQAARAMKGRTLREEVWRDDGTSPAAPYAVSQSTWV